MIYMYVTDRHKTQFSDTSSKQ